MELNPLSKRFGILFVRSLLRIGSSVTVATGYLRLLLIVGGTSLLTLLVFGATTESDIAGGH